MNYLAHLQLAARTNTSLVGAILGDFIKGRRYLELSAELRVGVRLHRKVDAYTEDNASIRNNYS